METPGIPSHGDPQGFDRKSEIPGGEGIGFFLAVSLIAWTILHGPTLYRMATTILSYQENWQSLAVPFFMVLLYRRYRTDFSFTLDPYSKGKLCLLATVVTLYAAGWIFGPLFLLEAAMITHLVWIAASVMDRKTLEQFWPILAFFYFVIPPPLYISTHLFAPLKKMFSIASANFLMWLDFPLLLDGTRISFPEFDFMVVDECSGMRSLATLVIFAIPLATLSAVTFGRRILLIASAIPLALFINYGRIISTAMMGCRYGSHYATGNAHTAMGILWLMIGFMTIALLAVAMPYEKIWRVNTWLKMRPPYFVGRQKVARAMILMLALVMFVSSLGAIAPYFRSSGTAEAYYRDTVSAFYATGKHPRVIMVAYKYLRNSMNPDMEFLEMFANSMIAMNRVKEALGELQKFTYRMDLENLNFLLASLHFLNGDFQKSLESLEHPVARDNLDPYLLLKVRNYMMLGRYSEADPILDRLVRRNINNFIYPLLKAENLFKSGMPHEEVESYIKARMAESTAKGPFNLILGELAMIRGLPGLALDYFEECYENSRNRARYKTVTGACLAALSLKNSWVLKKWTARLREFDNSSPTAEFLESLVETLSRVDADVAGMVEKALTSANGFDSREIRLLQAAVFISGGKTALAESILKSIFADNPDYVPATRMEFELLLARGDLRGAGESLRDLVAEGWPSDDTNLCRARLAMADKNYPLALDILSPESTATESSVQTVLIRSAAMACLGRKEEAAGEISRLHPEQKSSASSMELYRAGMILHGSGDTPGAEEYYRKSISRDESNYHAMNNLAWILLDRDIPAEALSLSEKAYKVCPGDAFVADTHGWMLYRNGLFDAAKKVYASIEGTGLTGDILERAKKAGAIKSVSEESVQ